jgi:hypothetical protein
MELYILKQKFLKANVPQCSEAYLLVEMKTAPLPARSRFGKGRLAKKLF